MKSFESLTPAGAASRTGRSFTPLHPAPSAQAVGRQPWRPLFGEEGRADAVERHPDPAAAPAGEQGATPEGGGPDAGRSFEDGYALGRQEAEAEVEPIVRALGESLQAVATFRTELRHRYERKLLELALGVARKVLHTELAERPETWLAMIRQAVERVVERETVRVRVPGMLAAYLRERLPELRSRLEHVKELAVVDDPGLPEGGCVIESEFGEVDLGIDTQIDRIERELTRAG
jgi:flagellar biosynthesis/type III secretory pathway protein FliH